MTASDNSLNNRNSRSDLLVTHAVLTGLTPLVPIPFVDDYVYAYFMRSMVQRLADSHARQISPEDIAVLASQPGRGCALGCLGSVLLYPIKKVLRKVFFFLELKRAVDTITHTYYQGYLIDAALDAGWFEQHGARKLRAAIDAVLMRTNTSLFSHAISGVVNQSKGILKGAGELLTTYLSGNRAARAQDDVARVVASVEEEETTRLGGLTSQLQSAIATLPAAHFEQLKLELSKELTSA